MDRMPSKAKMPEGLRKGGNEGLKSEYGDTRRG
jgi:hypothetical protein